MNGIITICAFHGKSLPFRTQSKSASSVSLDQFVALAFNNTIWIITVESLRLQTG